MGRGWKYENIIWRKFLDGPNRTAGDADTNTEDCRGKGSGYKIAIFTFSFKWFDLILVAFMAPEDWPLPSLRDVEASRPEPKRGSSRKTEER